MFIDFNVGKTANLAARSAAVAVAVAATGAVRHGLMRMDGHDSGGAGDKGEREDREREQLFHIFARSC